MYVLNCQTMPAVIIAIIAVIIAIIDKQFANSRLCVDICIKIKHTANKKWQFK
jgi:hypothetical protein